MRPTVSIVTAWKDALHFLPAYLEAVKDADQVLIVDGGCSSDSRRALMAAFGSMVHYSPDEWSFAGACNQGLKHCTGDIVVMLNNDVRAVAPWLSYVRAHVRRGAFYGPEVAQCNVQTAGILAPFISGWCMAARRDLWNEMGGFDADRYKGGYWEDNDLCFRATLAGYSLVKVDWPIQHIGNGTSGLNGRETPQTIANRILFHERVREAVLS